jgi:F-type H+-transporting ATPase subunit gamma
MATLKTIRKRITSVKNTQKITKAMKMVAASKLRRAQTAVQNARPYAGALKDLIISIKQRDSDLSHPLFESRDNPRKASFLIFTSNRGLCGGFNSNLLRRLEGHFKTLSTQYQVLDLRVVGKKGRDFYKNRNRDLKDVFLNYAESFPFDEAKTMAEGMIQGFLTGDYDEYFIVYNQFKSAIAQEITIEKIFPFEVKASENQSLEKELSLVDYIYEPSKKEVLDSLIPKLIATQLYRAHLESLASELGARMTAMENATNNAKDMIGKLTLVYNRVRQAAITTELMDIVNGAEAIK